MTEHFGFFDAIQDSNGHYDREYNAQQWNEPFRALVTTGVMKGAYNQLEVTANGSNMTSSVKSGIAFIEGRFYFNDALVDLIHDTEVMGLSRIDRIVVRMDSRTEARHVKTFIKKGVPAASPVPPVLTQTQQLYEISLAQVRVVGGQTYITANAVTDERGKDVICPWAGSKILPNFDNNYVLTELEGKADKQVEGPYIPTLNTGHSYSPAYAAYPSVKYFKDSLGFVHMQGVVQKAVGAPVTMFTLPVGYRPNERTYSLVQTNVGTTNTITIIQFNEDGTVQLIATTSTTIMTIFINAQFKIAD